MLGVAGNSAAPSSVLLRLLGEEGRPAWRTLCRERALPEDVIEAVLTHPARAVRVGIARNPYVEPEQRARLVEDANPWVRAALATGPSHMSRPKPLPDATIVRLLTARYPDGNPATIAAREIREELSGSGQVPQSFRRAALTHPDPLVRAFGVSMWLFLTPEQRAPLLIDPAPEVQEPLRWHLRLLDPETAAEQLPDQDCHYRYMILANYAVSPAVAERCFAEQRNLWALAGNPHTPYEFVQRLAREADPAIRARVAARSDLDPDLYARLAEDPEPVVRTRILVHELPRTETQCRIIDSFIGRSADDIGMIREWSFNPAPPEWFASCALSGHPLLRRIAASFAQLPTGLAERLAQDPDDDVRHLLAYNHPLAPPHLLLEAFIAGRRSRRHLLGDPRLPRTGLAYLLDHQDPEVRALATADTTLPQPPVAQLADSESARPLPRAHCSRPSCSRSFSTTPNTPRRPRATRAFPRSACTSCSTRPGSRVHRVVGRPGTRNPRCPKLHGCAG
ncbi:hypothetical protein KDL01_01130 [Actinospica durhamensis]|uniref:Leucine rich repeat variant n=1 Tax=Actinospica durhamensis TaxID=1508375 RepID=A0A941EI80_9ACTN|nr:hypothetical protein [Actinospica durhamensis]MBR7831841.1 hypothetical protein [Actinospica durhamensis]